MTICSVNEHYRLPAIEELAKPDDSYMLMKEAVTKSGMYKSGPQGDWPEGINDLGAGRIAAMDAAAIDVQILSHVVPGVEMVGPSLAVNLATQANDMVAAAIAKLIIKEYLRDNFYGGILAGELVDQSAGEMNSGWRLANNVYQAMVNVIGIDRIVFTTDYRYANMKATRQFFDQTPISHADKKKIAHPIAERLFGMRVTGIRAV